MSRRLARELAFQIIFQIDVGQNSLEDALTQRLRESELTPKNKQFCEKLVRGTITNLDNIDKKIAKYAIEWQLDRMLSVDRNLLRLAVFEILYCEDIPAKVSINEALELAKIFGADDSGKFINGILGKLVVARDE